MFPSPREAIGGSNLKKGLTLNKQLDMFPSPIEETGGSYTMSVWR